MINIDSSVDGHIDHAKMSNYLEFAVGRHARVFRIARTENLYGLKLAKEFVFVVLVLLLLVLEPAGPEQTYALSYLGLLFGLH